MLLALIMMPAAGGSGGARPRGAVHSVVYSQGVGNYTDHNVHSPCGLANETAKISWDQPEMFNDPAHVTAQIVWFGYGYVEYTYHQNVSRDDRLLSLCLTAELASEASGYNFNYLSDITVSFAGKEACTWTSPGDPGGRRGTYVGEFWSPTYSNWGYLKHFMVNGSGTYIDGKRAGYLAIDDLGADASSDITVRLAVKENAVHRGGMNLYGSRAGDYPFDLMLEAVYEAYEPPPPPPRRGVSLEPAPGENATGKNITHAVEGGTSTVYDLVLRNTGEAPDDIGLSGGTAAHGWSCAPGATFHLQAGQAINLSVALSAAAFLRGGDSVVFTVTATSMNDSSARDPVLLRAVVAVRTGLELWCDEPVLPVDAGASVSFLLDARNTGNVDDGCDVSLEVLDASWTASLQTGALALPAGEGARFLVNATPSPLLRADDAGRFLVTGRSRADPALTAAVRLRAIVNPSYFIRAQAGSLVERVYPGGTATFNVTLDNIGNTEDTARFSLSSPAMPGWTAPAAPPDTRLGYRGNATLRLVVRAPDRALAGDRWSGLLHIASAGNASNVWDIRLTVIVLELSGWEAEVTPARQEAAPGSAASWNLSLWNFGNLPRSFLVRFEPSGGPLEWALPELNLTVPPYSNRTERASCAVPPGALAGERRLLARVTVGGEKAAFTLAVAVTKMHRAGVAFQNSPYRTPIGGGITVRLEVRNDGNCPGEYAVAVRAAGIGCGGGRNVSLGPFSSANITLALRVPADAPARSFRLEASAVSDGGGHDSRSTTLEVVEKPPYIRSIDLAVMLAICAASALGSAVHERLSRRPARDKT